VTPDQFAQLLKDAMGLDVASVGPTALERAVDERRRARGCADLSSYWRCVRSSPEELQHLIDAAAVTETWFFRDARALDALCARAAAASRGDTPLRILSVPCSTGEEPYSVAMALLDAGVDPARVRVDAFDISARALEHARQGLYRPSAFRGAETSRRDRYFDRAGDRFAIGEGVRRCVRFARGNLLAPDFLASVEPYDFVFCRNVLIYFDVDTQRRAVAALARALKPDGLLFVGPSESGVLLSLGFASARIPLAFAFQHAAPAAPSPPPVPRAPVPIRPRPRPLVPPPSAAAPLRAPARSEARTETLVRGHSRPARLDEARRLADEGRLVEAAVRCNEELQQAGPSAEAFYLLGLVRDASGNHAEAASYYRKVLYLDPAHTEALGHLALLVEAAGNAAEARLLRDRIARLSRGR
jgi:chemotaxis protein methyltransferase WspC